MTATVECLTITDADAAEAIDRCHAILRRAAEGAWQRGGHPVVYAMADLRAHLRGFARIEPGQDKTIAVLAAEGIAERLITVIRGCCGPNQAEYVQEGDEL